MMHQTSTPKSSNSKRRARQQLADLELIKSVNAAIEALCEEQRTAIVLREFQGLSYSQVASAMSCPVGTVRSRVFRAREAIDDQLRRVFNDGLGRAKHNVKSQSWATGGCVV